MHGTWKVTGYGLLGSLGMLGFAAMGAAMGFELAVWLLARIGWIIGAGAVLAVLVSLALAWLMRLGRARDERDALAWQRRRAALSAQPATDLRAETIAALPRAERAAVIEQHVHYHLHVAGGTAPARVNVIPGTAGDITEGN